VLMTDDSWEDDGGSIDVFASYKSWTIFNLRCWFFLNNNKLVLKYCAIFHFVLHIIILCYL
jgi:hypothetical protein